MNNRFKKGAYTRRAKAVIITIAFHVVLLTALTSGSTEAFKEYIPDFVMEWFAEAPQQVDQA